MIGERSLGSGGRAVGGDGMTRGGMTQGGGMARGGGMAALVRIAAAGGPVAGRLALAVLMGAAAAGAAIGLSAASAYLISRASQQPPILDLMVTITAVRFFGISRGVFRYLERLTSHDAAFRVLARIRGRVYERLEKLAPAGLEDFRSGDLLARLVDDIDGLADVWLRVLLPYLTAALTTLAAVALVWYLVPLAGFALGLSLIFVAFAVPVLTASVARAAERRIAAIRGELAAETLEVLSGASELLVSGATRQRLDCLSEIDGRLAGAEMRTSGGLGLGALLSSLAGGVAVWFGLIAGIVAVRAGALDGVALAVVALTPLAVHESVMGLSAAAQHVPALASMAGRVLDVTARPDPVVEPATPAPPPKGPFGLRVRNLRARYDPDGTVLAFPDVELEAGGRLLVTGPSGSGKTTFANLLVRFLDATVGSIELVGADGSADIATLSSADVRRIVCLCEQEPHVFDTSIVENVRLARPDATDAEISTALARAQLSGWIASLPEGATTLVGEHGARVSGGQRQRLALARALLADAPVIVFDEPTEHVDEAMAAALTADLLEATAGRTVIMISHRPELIESTGWTARIDLGDREGESETAAPAL
jgi:ATP-binding cassette subfamily C protein CydCD